MLQFATEYFSFLPYKIDLEITMSLENRAKATAKNIEGKAQEAMGEVTGDNQQKAKGKAKQAEAKGRHMVEDIKDNVKQILD